MQWQMQHVSAFAKYVNAVCAPATPREEETDKVIRGAWSVRPELLWTTRNGGLLTRFINRMGPGTIDGRALPMNSWVWST